MPARRFPLRYPEATAGFAFNHQVVVGLLVFVIHPNDLDAQIRVQRVDGVLHLLEFGKLSAASGAACLTEIYGSDPHLVIAGGYDLPAAWRIEVFVAELEVGDGICLA